MLVPFPNRTLLPRRQQETTDEEISALLSSLQKLSSLHMAEA
jgi:hypothetical protein